MVKGKILLCQSNISDFTVEMISDMPFYNRYSEILGVLRKYIKDYDVEALFAQPVENAEKASLDWYIPQTLETPVCLDRLMQIMPDEYETYKQKRELIAGQLSEIGEKIENPVEKVYFNCAVKNLNEEYADRVTYCYDGNITFAMWGMRLRKERKIETVVSEADREHRIHTVQYIMEGNGRFDGNTSIIRLHNHLLQGNVDIPRVVPDLHFSFVEWKPEAPQGKAVDEDKTFTAVCQRTDDYELYFQATDGGSLTGNCNLLKKPGEKLYASDIPQPTAEEGFHFDHWQPAPPVDEIISDDSVFTAIFAKDEFVAPPPIVEPTTYSVSFDSGENGTIENNEVLKIQDGDYVDYQTVPNVSPDKGYRFAGWDRGIDEPITEDTVFRAQYEKKNLPWWRRFWLWLSSFGCLKWLLNLLLLLLLLFLGYYLLHNCGGCSGFPFGGRNGVRPIKTIKKPDGTVMDDNGKIRPITGADGVLPETDGVVAPIISEDGTEVPIVENPGAPDVIANRLFLFLEDEDGSIDELAKAFKKAYPEDKYSIIGFDREVKSLVVQVPPEEREEISKTINSKIPDQNFLVFDEEIYELNGYETQTDENEGWHLKAVHLQEGWKITKGSEEIKIAVLDDGIEASHPMFKNRIVDAYNVFTQTNELGAGVGHGTHVAGLAAGSDEFFAKGAAGIAPGCKLIPVQVFDNKRAPLSALVSGTMYAVHHGADVVNLSVAPSFQGLNALPEEQQMDISRNHFKNVEALWNRVCKLASRKNCILVFAAGNDDIFSSVLPENRNESSIVVTAVDKQLSATEFTNYGPCSDISAPGKGIYSSVPKNNFASYDGTSQAAPIVAGTVALMKSLKKDITVEQARNVLYRTGAEVKGNIPPMVLVDKALEAVQKGDFSALERRVSDPVPDGSAPGQPSENVVRENNPSPGITDDVSVVGPGKTIVDVSPVPQDRDVLPRDDRQKSVKTPARIKVIDRNRRGGEYNEDHYCPVKVDKSVFEIIEI